MPYLFRESKKNIDEKYSELFFFLKKQNIYYIEL